MPSIKTPQPVPVDRIQEIVQAGCPDLDFGRLGVTLTASRSRWVAAAIGTRGNAVTVNPMVRDMPTMLLLLLMSLTGIGLMLYVLLAFPKQKALVARVTSLLQRELSPGGVR